MLDKNQIQTIFTFEFKMSHKAVEITWNINKTFGLGAANEHTVQWWFKEFYRGDKSLEDEEHCGHQKLTMNNWEDHWSQSSFNYVKKSCQRTHRRPFYGHSSFEANWKGEKAR